VPFEIEYAIDNCELPIIVAYTGYESILNPKLLSDLWPKALKERIENGTAKAIHIPFKKEPFMDAMSQFNLRNKPSTSLNYYSKEAYKSFGIEIK
jgi:hypothetical protein